MLHLLPFSAIITALAFALSSAGKATSRAAFERAIGDLQLVPQRLTKPLVLAVLAAESAVVSLIVAPQARPPLRKTTSSSRLPHTVLLMPKVRSNRAGYRSGQG